MFDVGIMIEGQNGLTWPRWQRIARAVEDLGFCGLFRSDHYTNANPPDKESLELWISLAWLASHTSRIEFGPLVTPFSFRHPTMTTRMACGVDDLSGGRLVLGLGAGWQEREHNNYGWDLLDLRGRFARFEEGLQIINHLLHNDAPLDFEGQYYRLREAVLLPRPARAGGPPILIGGNGPRLTLPLAARFAREWNAVYQTPAQFAALNARLDELLQENGRSPEEIRRSVMLGVVYSSTSSGVEEMARQRTGGKFNAAQLRERSLLVGTALEIAGQIEAYRQAGASRVMLQWIDLDDIQGLESLARSVIQG